MRTLLTLGIFLFVSLIACAQSNKLDAKAFDKKIKSTAKAIILDVRTPSEFADGHIAKAININWNDANFETEVKKLDKTKPVFVYCQAGGRSAAAASKMKSMGFKIVYELSNGIAEWKKIGLPVTK